MKHQCHSTGQKAFWMMMKKFEFLKKNLEEAIRKHIERHNRETEKAFLITAETVQKKKDEKK
jgi:hypothetical protein